MVVSDRGLVGEGARRERRRSWRPVLLASWPI
jgi:hypothetical protein